MSSRPLEEHRCSSCRFKAKTRAGLNSHISQSLECFEKVIAANQPSTDLHKRRHSETPVPGGSDNCDVQPLNDDALYSSLLEGQPSSKRARVEDEEDFPIKMNPVFSEFEPAAGAPQQQPPGTSNNFERLQASQQASGREPWAPFSSIEDWDYARWIMNSGLSQRQIDAMLGLDMVSEMLQREYNFNSPYDFR